MLPVGSISHRAPRRLRVKIPSRKGRGEYFARVHEELSRQPGIDKIEVNHVTGSVLVLHKVEEKAISAYAEEKGLFTIEKGNPRAKALSRRVGNGFGKIDRKVKSFSGGGLDLPEATFLALAGMGIYQIAKGNLTAPAWYTAFWYAFNVFLKFKPE